MVDDSNISEGEEAADLENPSAFEEELSNLISSAIMSDVSIEGAWDITTDDGQPDFTVEIYRMERQ